MYSIGLSLFLILAAPFYIPRVLRGRYRSSFRERLGWNLEKVEGPVIWVHACSVGEVEAAVPIVALIQKKRPGRTIVVSTGTETGQARAKARFPCAAGAPVHVRYLPFDFLCSVRRHLDAVGSVSEFFIMETELWPNLIRELSRRNVPIFIANGRISDRAWRRYRRVTGFFKPIMSKVTAVAARTEVDAERFRALGAMCVAAVGNIKFDCAPAAGPADVPSGRIIIFGSTHPGEEEICMNVFGTLKKKFPDLKAILAPRHIERAKELLGYEGEDVRVLATHGELAGLYSIAYAAFIGGSLVPIGGHNPIEAAIHGVPVIWGPHIENFRDATALLGEFSVGNGEELSETFDRLLTDRNLRDAAGARAKTIVLANRGATERNWQVFGL